MAGPPYKPIDRAEAVAALRRVGPKGSAFARSTAEDRGHVTPCWIWGGASSWGYGSIGINGKNYQLHRVSRVAFRGDLTVNDELDHLCRQKRCWNPSHLEIVSRGENVKRMYAARPDVRERIAARVRKTVCKRGHSLGPDGDVRLAKSGSRVCRACRREKTPPKQTAVPFRGVAIAANSSRYRAYFYLKGRQIHVGTFDTPEVAARAYDSAARAHFGANAKLNFPEHTQEMEHV